MPVRTATVDDVPHMARLAGEKRRAYEAYSPVFWRVAPDDIAIHARHLEKVLGDADRICLIDDALRGFVIGSVVDPPPVYAPGGKALMVDDFVVANPAWWETVGKALRNELHRRAAERGVAVSITVCGHQDEPKRTALRNAGATVASEWYVQPLG
ncbi:MAG: hypothetical protein AAGD32_10465 [Planctomycetota bacterium]